MSAVLFAYHDVGCRGIRVLHRLGIPIAAVYTHDDDPTENTWFGSVQATCRELGIPVKAGVDPHGSDEVAFLRKLRPAAFFSFYYRDLLKPALLAIPQQGGVNLHGSLLPRYRGRAPVNWQLVNGEKESGATLHYMVRRADAGDIVDQERFAVGTDDTPTDLFRKLLPAAERVLERSARAVMAGTAPRIRQLESKATTFGRRTPADGCIDWHHGAEDVRNLVRAVTHPYPGAFTFAHGRKLLVWWADFVPERDDTARPAGMVTHAPDGVHVICGDRRQLRLAKVECEGKAGAGTEFASLLEEGTLLTSTEKTITEKATTDVAITDEATREEGKG